MIESANSLDPETGVRIVSLYSDTRKPSMEALEKTNVLLIDLQERRNAGLYLYYNYWPLPRSGSLSRDEGGRPGQAQSHKWYGN